MSITETKDVYWNVSDLDPTPVADLEHWHREYDPCASAELDRRLDDLFGPIHNDKARRGAAVQGRAWRGGAGHGLAGVQTNSGSAEAEPPTTGSIA